MGESQAAMKPLQLYSQATWNHQLQKERMVQQTLIVYLQSTRSWARDGECRDQWHVMEPRGADDRLSGEVGTQPDTFTVINAVGASRRSLRFLGTLPEGGNS